MPLTGICFLSQERVEKKSEEVLEVEPLLGAGDLMCCRRSGAG